MAKKVKINVEIIDYKQNSALIMVLRNRYVNIVNIDSKFALLKYFLKQYGKDIMLETLSY